MTSHIVADEKLFVSIVTVVRNDPTGLRNTVASIKSQISNPECFEHIIVDGASEDGTLDMVGTDHRYEIQVVSERDAGIYDAMNKGIALARAPYIIFMNAGDVFASDFVLDIFFKCETKYGFADLYYGDSYEVGIDGKLTVKLSKSPQFLRYGMFTHHQAIFYRRSSIACGYDLSYPIGADYALTALLAKSGAFKSVYLGIPVCNFAIGGSSYKRRKQGRVDVANVQRKILELGIVEIKLIKFVHVLAFIVKERYPNSYHILKTAISIIFRKIVSNGKL